MSKKQRDKKPREKEEPYSSNTWSSVEVKCPFWKGETTRAVVCEGLTAGENFRRLLPGERAKKALMREFCCNHYETCKIFQLVYGGYK